jgi:hypothetical protein
LIRYSVGKELGQDDKSLVLFFMAYDRIKQINLRQNLSKVSGGGKSGQSPGEDKD